uniref:Uncharacterized protein n=1 Tax=Arundo donax TaxID=35708 RepID=A0A0A9GIC1_ARUDO
MPLDVSQVKPISTKGKPRMTISPLQLYKELQFLQPLLFAFHPVVQNVVALVGQGGWSLSLGKGKLLLLTQVARKLLHMEYNMYPVHSNTDVLPISSH